MKAIKIGTNRLISIVLSIVMCATILTGAIWALSNLFKTGMSIVVTYDPLVNAKVYLSTDSTGAELAGLRQPSSDNIVTVNNFKKENSALVLNTHDTDNNGGKVKKTFEDLGKDGSSLICDANGEMQFYVFVENFSETESVYYRADITFGNTGETTPFSEAENPRYAVSEAVSDSTGGGGVTSSLLVFKIKANDPNEGINSDQIIIKIELYTELQLSMLGLTLYDETNTGETGDMRKNYIGLYYFEFGEYPQSLHGTTLPEGTNATPNEKGYYENPATGLKYAFKSPNYYLVEPVRWLVIGNGGSYNGLPNKNYDSLANNQLLLLSEKVIVTNKLANGYTRWRNSILYQTFLPDLKMKLFGTSELEKLGDMNEGSSAAKSQLSILSYQPSLGYFYNNYCTTSQLMCNKTDYAFPFQNNYFCYWLKYAENSTFENWPHIKMDTGINGNADNDYPRGIRQIIILNI